MGGGNEPHHYGCHAMFSKTVRHRGSHAQSPQLRCRSRCFANRGCRGMQETSGRPRGQWVGAHGDITQERDISVCHRRGHLSIEGPSEHPSRLLGPSSPGRCVATISHGSVEPPREGGAGRRHCDRQVVPEHSNRDEQDTPRQFDMGWGGRWLQQDSIPC